LVPVYLSETGPRQIRGALVSTYQLFITMGILTSYCINLGTSQVQQQSGSWRAALAISYLWAGVLAIGYLILKENHH
jgi:MFS transporter, SP family, sugar:H+ symporter